MSHNEAMNECPHCGKQALSSYRKYDTNALSGVACRECGRKVGVPGAAVFSLTPFIVGIFLSMALGSPWGLVAGAVGFVLFAAIYLRWPLEKR